MTLQREEGQSCNTFCRYDTLMAFTSVRLTSPYAPALIDLTPQREACRLMGWMQAEPVPCTTLG